MYRIACSNRTFMELKPLRMDVVNIFLHRSNRTFMELKLFSYEAFLVTLFDGSNRTFMELKPGLFARLYVVQLVLIVPLWN